MRSDGKAGAWGTAQPTVQLAGVSTTSRHLGTTSGHTAPRQVVGGSPCQAQACFWTLRFQAMTVVTARWDHASISRPSSTTEVRTQAGPYSCSEQLLVQLLAYCLSVAVISALEVRRLIGCCCGAHVLLQCVCHALCRQAASTPVHCSAPLQVPLLLSMMDAVWGSCPCCMNAATFPWSVWFHLAKAEACPGVRHAHPPPPHPGVHTCRWSPGRVAG